MAGWIINHKKPPFTGGFLELTISRNAALINHIVHLDQRLNLLVETGWCRFENINLRLIGSQFNQWQAKVTGTIDLEAVESVVLNEQYGLLEQHYAKW